MKRAFGDKHVERFLQQHALPGEEVKNWVKAFREGEFEGRLITTDERLVYYRHGILSEKIEIWSLNKISSIETKVGLLMTEIQMFTSGDKIKVTIASEKRLAREYVAELQLAINRPAETAPADSAPQPIADTSADPMAMLAKLGELKAAGILSEDEFQAKKAELLARI